ncbi:MAG: glycosyltransferase, partial [Bacteroidales bacterium]|nr:glycosyltransferase [Bacteroidales bacterium]
MKTNILHIIRQGKIGGGETHVLDLVQILDKDRFNSTIISFTDGEMVDRSGKMGIKCLVIPTTKPFDFSVWSKISKIAAEENANIIHAHGTRACSNSFRTARKLNIPLIYTIHGWSFHRSQPIYTRMFRELSERFLVRQSTVNIAVSDANRQEGIDRLKMPHSVVVKNGINLNKFCPDGVYKDIRQELGVAGETTLVGYIVRLTEQKDPLTFIRTIRCVTDRKPDGDIRFLIVGDGDLKQQTLKLADQLGVSSQIIFQGFRTDVPDILHAIDIYCLPSLWEGLPIGLLEAMAMKKAIVATPVDGTKEIVSDRENGLLVPVKDPEKLSDAIIELHNDRLFAHRLAENAHKDMKQKYN